MGQCVLWLCPAAGVDPASPINGVEIVCAHSVGDLSVLRRDGSLDVSVVVLDDMPIEPWGYDPTRIAARAVELLAQAPRHIVHVIRHGFQTCSYYAQTAFAVEAHKVLGPDAYFHLQLAARYDIGTGVDTTTEQTETASPSPRSQIEAKKEVSGMQMRWRDIAALASDLTLQRSAPGRPSPLPTEATAVVRAFGNGAGALSPAAQAVLVKLAEGVAASAVPLADATGYAQRTIRKAVTDVALIRSPEGGSGTHWTMSTASALARDYGPWLSSRAARRA